MKCSKLLLLIFGGAVLFSVPMFADSWTAFNNPEDGNYIERTNDFGGGDGSGGFITTNGPFTYSNPQSENSVPGSWATWNSPPFVESSTPNVLFNVGFSTLHVNLEVHRADTIAGFELEPDNLAVETITAVFHSVTGDSFTITRDVDGNGGALLFAAEDSSAPIRSIDITDEAGGDFATAQWRYRFPEGTPEPSTILMFSSGLLAGLGVIRRKINL